MSDNEEPEMQENKEVYRVNINDDTRPSNEFTRTHLRHSSAAVDPIQIPGSRVQQQSRGRRGSSSQRSLIPSRVLHGSGSRGSSPSSGGNNFWGQTSAGQWGQHPGAQ
ncbi:unnamed protein product [Brassica rapa subsp. trilocularis]